MMCSSRLLLLLFCLLQLGLGVELTFYPHAPGTVLDPRVVASVRSGSNRSLSDLRLAVEDAPATPQTRDPGHGRPPFTSSRLRLATGDGISSVRVTLQCIGVGCTFGKGAILRGPNFNGRIEDGGNGSSLVFNLPTPGHHIATHYYLQVMVHNAAGAPHFARGKLFYFWLDSQDSMPPPTRPTEDVTAMGIVSNSTASQTTAIQRLLDNITLPRLYFPGPQFTGQRACLFSDRYRLSSEKERPCNILHLQARSMASIVALVQAAARIQLFLPSQRTTCTSVAEAARWTPMDLLDTTSALSTLPI